MKKTYAASLGMHILEIEVTTRCNLNCKHCYNRGSPTRDLPFEEIIQLIDFAFLSNVKTLVITGGEACLHPKFRNIASYLKNRKTKLKDNRTRVVLQSNGVLLLTISLETLKAFDIFHISFDIDTNARQKTDHTLDTIKYLQGKNLNSYLFTTIHKKNRHLVKKMIDIANKSKVQIGFNIIQPSKETAHLKLSKDELRDTLRILISYYKKGKILRPTCPLTALLDPQKKASSYIGNKGGCIAGIASCAILPNGDVIPCPFFRIKSGNIFNHPIKKVWLQSKVFKTLRDRSKFDNPCGNCERLSYCGGCRSRAYTFSDKLTGPDPMCFKDIL